ncbi:NmrA family transcriptional regulator, partial [Streptomyces sp. NPDC005507]
LRISPDVERVLGRAPRPFNDWVARSIAAFR